ncbi:MAG: DnaA ATPase domain-containing protein, partial [Janthinobacterium lividum]
MDQDATQPVPQGELPAALADIGDCWTRVRSRLQTEVGDVEYRTWLRQMTLAGVDGDEVTVHLPTRFLRDWVRSHYADKLSALWQQENRRIRRVDVRVGAGMAVVGEEAAASPAPPLAGVAPPVPRVELAVAAPVVAPERAEGVSLDQRFSFASFVVGKPNEFAHACARRVAERPASPGFNPLFLYGGVGLGKTHLMHAIGLELGRTDVDRGGRPVPSVAYMSAEKFMYRFIAAIRSQSTMEFKEELRSVDVLMI